MPPAKPLVIAIDGPGGAGKGTLARALAVRFGLPCLDTGTLYRAVAARLLQRDTDINDAAAATAAAQDLDPGALQAENLRDPEIAAAASVVAAMPGVRNALIAWQRRFAQTPPGAVLDGRDIGTVIAPDADAKIFLTADVTVRAERRYNELRERGVGSIKETVLRELKERDARDSARGEAPMKPASDALMLDTTDRNAADVLAAAVKFIMAQTGEGAPQRPATPATAREQPNV